jgi:hypothetical protein
MGRFGSLDQSSIPTSAVACINEDCNIYGAEAAQAVYRPVSAIIRGTKRPKLLSFAAS